MLGGCEGMRGCMLSRAGVGRDLHETSLSGTLPESVGEMTRLSLLTLYSTSLSGTLPESVGEMTGLSDL